MTDHNHPEVLFIRCRGSIIILDIDNWERIVKLDEIVSDATSSMHYRIAVNKNKLVVVSDPDTINIYSLEHIYRANQVVFERSLPLYGYHFQATSEVEFSDFNDMVYVNAVDSAKNVSVILVYRTNLPSALALYAQITLDKLYSRPGLEIEVSGFFVDYLSIKTGDGFTVHRVFEIPQAVIENVHEDFKFQLSFKNSKSELYSYQLGITAVNNRANLTETEVLNRTLNNLKLDTSGNYTWDTHNWFEGHVLGYNFSCEECGAEHAKVHLKEHVHTMASHNFPAFDYAETITGGVAII